MSTEIELKLQLDAKNARKLAEHPLLAGLAPQRQRLLNTYYDTPDLALHQRRVALRFRRKGWDWLLTVKSAEPASGGLAVRNEWETTATPGQFDFAHVNVPELKNFLDTATARLEPIFTTDFRRQIWRVPFGESLIELALDRGHIASGDHRERLCEIELELLEGHVTDIFGLTRSLQKHLQLYPAIASKAERGYRLFRDEAPRPFKAKPPPLAADMTPVEAFRGIALACLEHYQRNEPGLQDGGEVEFVHQARVALRRLRSAIKLFTPILPPEFVTAYGQTWQTLASALGDARNWDVFLAETLPPIQAHFPDHRDVKRLRDTARQRARHARRSIARLLTLREYPSLIVEFTAAVYALSDTLPLPLKQFASERLAQHARRACKLAEKHAMLNAADRHRMRIAFKKLRYATEFFAPLLPTKRLAPTLAALGRLQDELGLINDHVTAETLIKEVLPRRSPGPLHGWMAGRHALLVEQLPAALGDWLAQVA
ncbi:MAG: CHAD domain-containing protein [Azonexus sp.]|jgi:inorganic triphosphatase YgiF|uniref:CYTH and CHAD domain-containing protein n=1 Tax=Azonexus sp. TaxID=1872668 RepID=UPI00283A8862|nr:CHAD domain-containing protein [Azonexus sp.]MDR0777545.1 CHAD domain-containing protein [Azonexus sp.]